MTENQKRRMNDLLEAKRQRELEPDEAAPVAATVLTDERIRALWREATTGDHGEATHRFVNWFARAIEAEVLAHASKGAAWVKGLTGYLAAELKPADTVYLAADVERLLAQAGVRAEPAGYKLVPIESTSAMDRAGRDALRNLLGDTAMSDDAEACYRAMVKAAPTAPTIPAQVPAAEVRAQALGEKAEQGKFAERLYGPAPSVDERRDALYTMALIFAAAESDSSREACFEDMYREFLAVPRMSIFDSLTRHTGAEISTNYTFEMEEFFEVEAVERVLAQSSTADKAGEVRAAEWISVDERMPEYGQTVIALYWPYNKRTNPQAVTSAEYINGEFFLNDGERMHYPSHWMPIPDAPSTADSGNTGALGEGASE